MLFNMKNVLYIQDQMKPIYTCWHELLLGNKSFMRVIMSLRQDVGEICTQIREEK